MTSQRHNVGRLRWWSIAVVIHCCSSSLILATSFVIQPLVWEYKTNHEIGYEVASSVATTTTSRRNSKAILTVKAGMSALNATDVTNSNSSRDGATALVTKSTSDARDQSNVVVDDDDTRGTPILLLNGFGVGSFHQHRLISRLFESSNNNNGGSSSSKQQQQQQRTVYCVDYLGQGRSWPKECQDGQAVSELGLQYSAETWIDQIVTFIEQVILPSERSDNGNNKKKKVHLVGNSVGGHLAAYIAVRRPDLIESICLLNPTPVWGLNLPGWSGTLPAPFLPKAIGRFLFDRIRDLTTIEQFLRQTYSRREAFSDELMDQIRGCTLGNGGHAAFASILWSPPLKVTPDSTNTKETFQDCLSRVPCDVLLVFGKDDPWCKPAFAKKMIEALDGRKNGEPHSYVPVHRYIEIENAGHCPNHEAPQAVAHLLRSWVDGGESNGGGRGKEQLTLVDGGGGTKKLVFQEDWGATSAAERSAQDICLGVMDRLATTFL